MINIKNNEKLNQLNHSCAHLMAHAIKNLYPQALFWVGPVIDEGFYYDIDLGEDVIGEDDLVLIEKEMKKLAKKNKAIFKEEITKEKAIVMFKNDPYKLDLITELDNNITIYHQDDFTDLCEGPHIESTKELRHFKLLKVSGAYYKGDSKNKMLQRVYGICFENEDDLKNHLNFLEEVKKRDHRKLGKDLKIFTLIPEAGQGLVFWLPNGMTLKKIIEDYSYDIQKEQGYLFVGTPDIGSKWLYETSGHWELYQDDMFPIMESDENETMILRPMSCPHHCLVYKTELRSYRELPLRYAEDIRQYRWEASGGLIGLERVRGMQLTDAHIYLRADQIKDEVASAFHLINKATADLGIKVEYIELALHDKAQSQKYHSDEKLWQEAETKIRNVLDELRIEYKEAVGEAAFYGPKIDFQVKTILGTIITLATIQLDFLLPERFDLTYINEEGKKIRPIMIHRGLISTYERLIAILLEQYAGAFPLWLSPLQVNIIPVNNKYHLDYAKKIAGILKENNIRVEIDERDEKMGYKIRESQTSKTPYTLILGDYEKTNNSISFRKYSEEKTENALIENFVNDLCKQIIVKK